jgi:hypothetical protein
MQAGECTTEKLHAEAKALRKVLHAAVLVSESCGGIDTSGRNIRATQLYTRLVLTTISFVRLLPGTGTARSAPAVWDWGACAALARMIMEIYNFFYYTGIDSISEAEVQFRWQLLQYHLNWEKYRLYKEWGAEESVLKEFEDGLPKAREALARNEVLRALPSGRQKQLLKGTSAMHLSHPEVAARSGVLGRSYRALYRLLSNQVHSSPFAFLAQSNVRGRGEENDAERFYITLSVQVVRECLARAALEMAEVFPEQVKHKHASALENVRRILADGG